MNLVVDIGNSRLKTGVFKGRDLIKVFDSRPGDYKVIKEIFVHYPHIKHAIISSVAGQTYDLELLLREACTTVILLDHNTKVPIDNQYKSKTSLGKDRLAAAIEAAGQFPNKAVMVIDAGTALTFEYINDKNQYLGGHISPGLKMRFRALHEFTEKLPLVEESPQLKLPARDTISSINSGVIFGIVSEIKAAIQAYKDEFPALKVIMTGGDANFLVEKIKSSIFVDPNLVLKGLNRILDYNAERN